MFSVGTQPCHFRINQLQFPHTLPSPCLLTRHRHPACTHPPIPPCPALPCLSPVLEKPSPAQPSLQRRASPAQHPTAQPSAPGWALEHKERFSNNFSRTQPAARPSPSSRSSPAPNPQPPYPVSSPAPAPGPAPTPQRQPILPPSVSGPSPNPHPQSPHPQPGRPAPAQASSPAQPLHPAQHPAPDSKCGSKKKLPKTFGQNFRSKLIGTQTLNNFYKP